METIHSLLKFEINSIHPNVNKLNQVDLLWQVSTSKKSNNRMVDQLWNPSQDADVKSMHKTSKLDL